jgi:hypothetical protein
MYRNTTTALIISISMIVKILDNSFFLLFIFFYFLLSHYTYNILQIYRQSLPIGITKYCHTMYIQIHALLVLPSLLV